MSALVNSFIVFTKKVLLIPLLQSPIWVMREAINENDVADARPFPE